MDWDQHPHHPWQPVRDLPKYGLPGWQSQIILWGDASACLSQLLEVACELVSAVEKRTGRILDSLSVLVIGDWSLQQVDRGDHATPQPVMPTECLFYKIIISINTATILLLIFLLLHELLYVLPASLQLTRLLGLEGFWGGLAGCEVCVVWEDLFGDLEEEVVDVGGQAGWGLPEGRAEFLGWVVREVLKSCAYF